MQNLYDIIMGAETRKVTKFGFPKEFFVKDKLVHSYTSMNRYIDASCIPT